ncbi:MAG TPA: FtsX-like permease family protein [Acidimicrobiales bacterium]
MLRVALRGVLAHKVRLVATTLAVLLGVAFMTGTQVLTSSVSDSFDEVFTNVYADIDVVVRSSSEVDTPLGTQRARIDEAVIPDVAGVDGVAAAEGQVRGQIRVLDKTGEPLVRGQGPPNVALNWLTDPALDGWTIVAGAAPEGPTEVVLDAKSATDAGYVVGDPVRISVTGGVQQLTLSGIARFRGLDTWGGLQAALFDTPTAQALAGEPGRFDWISVAAADGVSQEELRERVAAVLPTEAEALTGADFTEESQDAFQRLISVFSTFLLVFALIALFVGSFIIYNTFSIIVAQRTRELALLRALGASRRQVVGSVLIEALLVGFGASVLGVVCGFVLALGLDALVREVGFAGPETPLVVPPMVVVSSLLVGTLMTVAAALLPARRAASIAPVAAMRDMGIEDERTSRWRAAIGIVMLLTGVAIAYDGLFVVDGGSVQLLGIGALLVFLSSSVLGPLTTPRLTRLLGRPLPRLVGVDGRLAVANTLRSPRRTAITASALTIAVGLVGFIAVTAASVKASTKEAIDDAVLAQYVVTTDGFGPTALPPSVAEEIGALPSVEAAAGIGGTFASVNGERRLVVAADPSQLTQVMEFTDVEGSLAALDGDGLALSKDRAEADGITVGQTVEATFLGGGTERITVQAVYDTRFSLRGSGFLVTRELFDRIVPLPLQTNRFVYVKLADPSPDGIAAARPDLEAIAAGVPGAELQDLAEFRETQTARADQFLVIVYVLLALALVIAIVGVVNTLLLSVFERTRELGLLRAVGMARTQVRSSIRWESVLISLVGTGTGLAIGLAFGWALVRALADDGITVFAVPWSQLLVIMALAALAGVAAALYPAWRASRLDVLAAIAAD